ncbi:hypothetical protein OG474_12820 [Kribbella sp. NBC_01505]|uniref:hypothetical protein n=1 Tax=Kribbella sp. NBC_01505 TaxID=2903580 RepID=UPI003864F773
MRTLDGKAIFAVAMSWVRPSARREVRAEVPAAPVAETPPPMGAAGNNDREFTSYSLIGW